MRVRDITIGRGPNPGLPLRLAATVDVETDWLRWDPPFQLWFDLPAEAEQWVNPEHADPFLAAFLQPAMRLGERLELDGSISGRLNDALPALQRQYSVWEPDDYRPIEVIADVRPVVSRPPEPRRALFFSQGIDSSYALAKNLHNHSEDDDRLTHLVTVEGFDIYLWERYRFPPLQQGVEATAARYGMTPWVISTNIRDFSDRIVDWPWTYFGAALVAVALTTGPMFSFVRVAATLWPENMQRQGSHPITDNLWSTEDTRFFHDGIERTRVEKARYLRDWPDLLQNLRVCATDQETEAYNCGVCQKCVRTQLELRVAGALHLCPTLPHEVNLDLVRGLPLTKRVFHEVFGAIAVALTDSPEDVAIKAALHEAGLPLHTAMG